MGWATQYIEQLQNGESIQFRPRGNSMAGKINSGQLCTVEPIDDPHSLAVGDIVLCKVNGSQYLHLIKAIQGNRFQIGKVVELNVQDLLQRILAEAEPFTRPRA